MKSVQAAWRRLPESVRWGIVVFLAARVFFWLWGGIVMTLLPLPALSPAYQPVVTAPPGVPSWILEPWNRWDVFWYSRIAVQGYGISDGRNAFPPLFPLLIQLTARLLGGQYLLAAFLISDLACLGSLILLYELARREGYDGRRTTVALLLFPFAFFLFVPYTESLLLLLTLLAFLAVRENRWWLAGLCSALAVLTKATAIVLIVPLAWELWERRRTYSLWNGLWLAAIPLAAVGWIIVRGLLSGTPVFVDSSSPFGWLTPFLSSDFQVQWSNVAAVWPWESLVSAVTAPFRLWPRPETITAVVDLIILLLVLYGTILVFRLRRASFSLYTVATWLMSFVLIVRVVTLQDAPRRWMMAFPLFIAAAAYVPTRRERRLIYLCMLLQMLMSALYVKWMVVG